MVGFPSDKSPAPGGQREPSEPQRPQSGGLTGRLDAPRLGEIYTRTAAFYDGLVAELQAKAKLEALAALARRPGERCLEAGVGTGWAFERLVAASGAEGAFGIDLAAGMLEVARGRLGARAAGRLLLGDARRLPFAAATFDCLLSTYTLEVMLEADIEAAVADFLRVLRPGGRAVIVNLTEGEGGDAAMIEDWERRYLRDPEAFGGARPLRLQALLRAKGFEAVERRYVGGPWPSEVLACRRP